LLNARMKSLAARILPRFLLARLDPFQEMIEAEVNAAASRVAADQVVLDAGAGEGRHRRYFSRGHYIGLDSGVGDPGWDYSGLDIRGSLEAIPLASGSVDCVLCMVVLEHTPNPRLVLQEFARILKPGGSAFLVIPFLWEEHQAPHDYLRFTRHGACLLLAGLPFRVDLLSPIGGFFWVCARRCVNLLEFFQGGWRWILFVGLAPFFGLLLPLLLYSLDPIDRNKSFSLGFRIRVTKEGE